MGDADGDAGDLSGMGGRREGVMVRSGATVFFYVASVGIVYLGERGVPRSIRFEEGGCGVLRG